MARPKMNGLAVEGAVIIPDDRFEYMKPEDAMALGALVMPKEIHVEHIKRQWRNIAYGPEEGQLLDIYLPEEGDIVKFTYEANEMALTELELVGKERDYDAGWITACADDKVTVLLVNGDELVLTVDGETIDVLPGYEPKLNDFIYLVYDENTMELTYVRFLSRPEKLETNELYKSVLELNKKDKDE